MANGRTLAWLFISAVIIVIFWGWYSFLFMDFKNARSTHWGFASDSKLGQSPTGLGIQQGTTNATHNRRKSIDSKSTTEADAISWKHKTTLITTTSCMQNYFLLILVSSSPANAVRRRDIRKTWGVDFAIKPRWKTAFLVAQTKTELDSLLAMEDALYGDLVRANYYDHYWNQTLKIQMGFEWAARYCKFAFLLKTDDDTFVNADALVSHLSQPNTPTQKLYMGELYKFPPVLRSGKWKISFEEYSGSHYPDFCRGFGVVLSADIVALFVDLFDVVPPFRLDDVYIGMLANKAGIKVVDNEGFIRGPAHVTGCILQENTLIWHGIFGDCLHEVFSQTLKEKKFLETYRHLRHLYVKHMHGGFF